jgi:HSP20 family protein
MLPTLFRTEERSPISSLRGQIDRLFEDFFGDGPLAAPVARLGAQTLVPAMDVKEREDAFVAELDAPGMKAEDFKIEVQDGVLVIRGERRQEREEKTKLWHRTERVFGSFERHISLPTTVDAEKIDASYKDGLLTVTVPKSPGAKPKTITVKAR